MLAAVVLFSLIPLVLGVGGSVKNPFTFNAGVNVGRAVGCLIFLWIFYFPLLFNAQTIAAIKSLLYHPTLWLAVLGNFGYAAFALSIGFINISTATILFEMWPLFVIFIMSRFFNEGNRYKAVNFKIYLLLVLCIVGFVFVVAGQSGGFFSLLALQFGDDLIVGVLLAIFAALLAALAITCSLKWGIKLRAALPASEELKYKEQHIEIFCVVVSIIISGFISAIVNMGAGVAYGEVLDWQVIGIGFLAGVSLNAIGSTLRRQANLMTDNLGVNALAYTTLILSLTWLYLFSLIEVRLDYIVIGAGAIIVGNLLINFKAEIRMAYQSLVITIWAAGAVVYLRTGIAFDEHFNMVIIAVTMFILILSFRTDRLVRRTYNEENQMLMLWQNISAWVAANKLKPSAQNDLLQIDSHQSQKELRNAYRSLKESLVATASSISDDKARAQLKDMMAETDMLAHSKQQGSNFGELIALFILAFITVGSVLIFLPPNVGAWGGFFVELLAFLLTATVSFLFFNILDLQHDRTRPILEKDTATNQFFIAFRDAHSRRLEQWISIVICSAITIAYAFLLWHKWFT